MRRTSPWPMVPVDDVLAIIEKHAPSPVVDHVPVAKALGCVLAEDVHARDALPPFRASIKDGYAMHSADGPGRYRVMATVTAGNVHTLEVPRGSVVRITTGAPVPDSLDCVVMVERTVLHPDEHITVDEQALAPGQDIRAVGADIAAGSLVLPRGTVVGPAEVGLLATVGAVDVAVHRAPAVAVLSTGDELVEATQSPLGPGQIRDSNRPMLIATLTATTPTARIFDMGMVGDEKGGLEARVREALAAADVLITSGGVSMGETDLLHPLLTAMGTIHVGRVLMKPGKPLTVATTEVEGRRKMVIGLPGNPVSALVCCYLFAVPAIRAAAGASSLHLPRLQVLTSQPLPLDPQRPEYHRAELSWDRERHCYVASSTGVQASSRLLSARSATALLLLPQLAGTLPANSLVDAILIAPQLLQ